MTTQTTLFPKTELDEATAVLAHLISEEEKADKAADAAGQKAADTVSRVRKQRHVVAKLQAMMPAAEPIVDGETAPEDIEDAEILQIEGDVLDPITGEVTRTSICPDCDGDGRIPDKSGGGNHGTCETCEGTGAVHVPAQDEPGSRALAEGLEPVAEAMLADLADEGVITEPNVSVVIVLYPGSEKPVVTKIGEKTRYGELVADYFTAAGLNGKHDAKDWTVVAEDELTTTGGVRKLRDVIGHEDYGKRLLVVAAHQGSVTGVAVNEESAA